MRSLLIQDPWTQPADRRFVQIVHDPICPPMLRMGGKVTAIPTWTVDLDGKRFESLHQLTPLIIAPGSPLLDPPDPASSLIDFDRHPYDGVPSSRTDDRKRPRPVGNGASRVSIPHRTWTIATPRPGRGTP